jgi:hypothetical protein
MPQYMRHIDTIDPDVYVRIGFQYYRAQDIFGEPDVLVELKGACSGDEKDKEK